MKKKYLKKCILLLECIKCNNKMYPMLEELLDNNYINNTWTENNKILAINFYHNNISYVTERYPDIENSSIIQELFILSSFKSEINKNSIFSFLYDKFKIDAKYTNINMNNCLMAASWMNTDINFIKFLINNVGMNVKHENINKNNCLTLACQNNQNLEIIKYFINDCKMDQNHINCLKNNCLMQACHNINIEIIKYLINDLKMDVKFKNNDLDNCLTLACWKNTNLEIIKYLLNDVKMDINHLDKFNNNFFLAACLGNSNIDILKFLINNLKIDINYKNNNNDNCLTLACLKKPNFEKIKYLINVLKIDVTHKNKGGNNCLLVACKTHTSLEIIKFLSTCPGIDINETNIIGINCLAVASDLKTIEGHKIIKYLIDINVSLNFLIGIFIDGLKIIVQNIINYETMNLFIDMGIEKFGINQIKQKNVFEDVNLYLMNDVFRKTFNKNPQNEKYSTCVQMIDQLQCQVPIDSYFENKTHTINNLINCDYSIHSELLFKHNGISYFGQKSIVYDAVIILKKIKKISNLNEEIVLEGKLSKSAINQYINSCYCGKIDINQIEEDNFINFLKFIDQYPTIYLSVDKFEKEIIEYIDHHKVNYDDFLKQLCNRYQLKIMYLDLHNKNLTALNI